MFRARHFALVKLSTDILLVPAMFVLMHDKAEQADVDCPGSSRARLEEFCRHNLGAWIQDGGKNRRHAWDARTWM